MRSNPWVPVAIALVLAGFVSFMLQPVFDPEPDSTCAPAGAPSSGYVDEDKSDCNITDESWEAISDWRSKPKPFRIIGLVLVVSGIVAGGIGFVRLRRPRGGSEP